MSTYEALSLMLTFGLLLIGLVGLMYKFAQKKINHPDKERFIFKQIFS